MIGAAAALRATSNPLVPPRWQVPKVFHERLGEKAGRQRSMFAEGHLLLVLHKLPAPGDPERHARLFWRHPDSTWSSSEGGAGLGDLNEHLDEYERAIDQLEMQIQANPTADDYFAILNRSTPLLRAVRFLHLALQQAREAVQADRQLITLRDDAGEMERTLELLHADALHGLQFLVAAHAEEQAQASEKLVVSNHRLNLMIALFLPLTAVASLFGMNIHTGLEDAGPGTFLSIILICLFVGLIVMTLMTRRGELPPRRIAPRGKLNQPRR
jgi:hypothetical protein